MSSVQHSTAVVDGWGAAGAAGAQQVISGAPGVRRAKAGQQRRGGGMGTEDCWNVLLWAFLPRPEV